MIVGADQLRLPAAARGAHHTGIMNVDSMFQAMPRKGSIHRSSVHVNISQSPRNTPGVRAFAAGAGPIDRDDYGGSLIHVILRASPQSPAFAGFLRPELSSPDFRRASGKNSETFSSRTRDF